MPIKNYTTRISAGQTLQEIQKKLVAHGAKTFMIEYALGEPSGLCFLVPTKKGELSFRLPANVKQVRKVLEDQRVKSYIDYDMAARVAWRIIKDWVDAQLVTIEEVFLPYMLVPGEDKTTLYDAMVAKGFYLTEGETKS